MYKSLLLIIFCALGSAHIAYAAPSTDGYILPDDDEYITLGDDNFSISATLEEIMAAPLVIIPGLAEAANIDVPQESGASAQEIVPVPEIPTMPETEPVIREILRPGGGFEIVDEIYGVDGTLLQEKRFFRTATKNNWLDIATYDRLGVPHELVRFDISSPSGKFPIIRNPGAGPTKATHADHANDALIVYAPDNRKISIRFVGEEFVIADGPYAITTPYPVIIDDATGAISVLREDKEYRLAVLPGDIAMHVQSLAPGASVTHVAFHFVEEGHLYAVRTVQSEKMLGMVPIDIVKELYVDAGSGAVVGAQYPFVTHVSDIVSF